MKKYTAFFVLALIPLIAGAFYSEYKISNFSGNYYEPYGKGQAKEFLAVNNFLKGIEVNIEKLDENTLHINYGENQIIFNNLPAEIFEMKEITWQTLNFISNKNIHQLSLDAFDGKTEESRTQIEKLFVKCKSVSSKIYEDENILEGCFEQGQINFKKFLNSNMRKDGLLSVFFFRSLNYPLASDVKLDNLNLRANSNKFDLSVQVTSGLSAKIKASGLIWFIKDQNQLKIKLEKANAGIFSIREKIFEELEKSDDPKIKVDRPYIYYDLN